MININVPVFPESISEGTIATWHKKEGDTVSEGEIIAEIETDKVVMEVPSLSSGKIVKIIKNEGDTVLSGEIIANIEVLTSVVKDALELKASKNTNTQKTASEIDINVPVFPESISEGTIATWHKKEGDTVSEGEIIAEIETDKVVMEVPSLSSGKIVKIIKNEGDTVLSGEIIAKINTSESAVVVDSTPENKVVASDEQVLSPSARRAVKEFSVNPSEVTGSGKGGRIVKEDIATHNNKAKTQNENINNNKQSHSAREEKRVRMTRLRQTVATRLVAVQQTNAILTTFNEVDMKPVMDLRSKYKDLFSKTHDSKLGFMSFFLKAATEALKAFPEVNASIDGDDIVYHGYYDISVAVGSKRGLVVPVIKDTDQKTFADIENDILEKAIKARDGKLTIEEMQGGTFTITNGGTYGSMLSTPILNAPQSAILGMHNIVERAVVINGEIVIRPIMYLALSYDHRIIDGSVSVRFLKAIKESIEDPARMLLNI